MSKVRELHNKAMVLNQKALVTRHAGDESSARAFLINAMELETQAADLIKLDRANEPTRSILYKSAASLALDAGEYAEALRLLAQGLSGFPPPQIIQELKNLYDQLNFESHLHASDLKLSNEEVQFTVLGNAVSHGIVLFDEFVKRLETLRLLFERTAARLQKAPYNRGMVPKKYKPFVPALSAIKAGSFSATLRLVVPSLDKPTQIGLFAPKPSAVVDEILKGVEFINSGDEQGLKEHISDEGYFTNFVSLTRKMAPDGKQINFVGLVTQRRSVGFTLPREEIHLAPDRECLVETVEDAHVTVIGVLDMAISRTENVIGLSDEDNQTYEIKIQEGMDDLVRSYFGQKVKVEGSRRGKYIELHQIDGFEE